MVIKMKALISKIEPKETGFRVAQVETDDNVFGVASDLFWVDCADDVVADQFWYDPVDKSIKPITAQENTVLVTAALDQAVVQGAQQL